VTAVIIIIIIIIKHSVSTDILGGTNSGDWQPSGVKIPGDETPEVEYPGVEQKLLSPSDEAE